MYLLYLQASTSSNQENQIEQKAFARFKKNFMKTTSPDQKVHCKKFTSPGC